ncbi:MAG TPA: TolC family protein [Flavobacterium sp.]|nr:TolC family protein [Flavobacterium sp.]
MKSIYKITFVAIATITLQSCIATKDYQKPDIEQRPLLNQSTIISTTKVLYDSTEQQILPWREIFTNSTLQNHIETALTNNTDLRMALENIKQAEAYQQQGRAGYLPTFNVGTNYTHSVNSINTQFGRILGQRQRLDQFDITANLGWEADIWGKITSKKLAAEATYLQTVATHQAIQTELIAMVASSYYNILALTEQRTILRKTLANRSLTLRTNKALKEAGRVTEVAVQQSVAHVLSVEAMLLDIDTAIKVQENSMSILMGGFPDSILRDSFTFNNSSKPLENSLKDGLSINVLHNRPDVLAAELGFRNAFELTNVAKASFYPTLRLTASGGLQSVDFEKLFDPTSFFASIIGGIAQPVLSGRQIRTQYEVSLSNQEKAFLNYKQTVLNASKEISDALYSIENNTKKIALKKQEADAYKKAVEYSQELLNNGMASYLEVLTATESELNAQLSIINTQYDLWNAHIQLYKAIGGGVE